MNKTEFNKYCSSVMGYKPDGKGGFTNLVGRYTPYDDLNQMAGVVEKLLIGNQCKKCFELMQIIALQVNINIKQAMRDFIISTMPEDKDGH